jgi:hypothetical protein
LFGCLGCVERVGVAEHRRQGPGACDRRRRWTRRVRRPHLPSWCKVRGNRLGRVHDGSSLDSGERDVRATRAFVPRRVLCHKRSRASRHTS